MTEEIIFERAALWYSEHKEHVTKLATNGDVIYAPSGSDLRHPELWKGAHWRWFMLKSWLKEHP